jgi:hypothetical protein
VDRSGTGKYVFFSPQIQQQNYYINQQQDVDDQMMMNYQEDQDYEEYHQQQQIYPVISHSPQGYYYYAADPTNQIQYAPNNYVPQPQQMMYDIQAPQYYYSYGVKPEFPMNKEQQTMQYSYYPVQNPSFSPNNYSSYSQEEQNYNGHEEMPGSI